MKIVLALSVIELIYLLVVCIQLKHIERVKYQWLDIIFKVCEKMPFTNINNYEKQFYKFDKVLRDIDQWAFNPINWFRSPIVDKETYELIMEFYNKE